MELLNSIDIIDLAFNEVNDDCTIYFRMDSSVIAIDKLSGALLWEYEIEHSSPIGSHTIWESHKYVIYGAVDLSTKNQIIGVLNKKGELIKTIKIPYRIYIEGINDKQRGCLEFLANSIKNNKNYYCILDLELLEINKTIEINNLVDSVFIEDDTIYLSGADGIFSLKENKINNVYNETILRTIKSKTDNWFVEESKESKIIAIKKWNQTNKTLLMFDSQELKKSTLMSKTILSNQLLVVFEDVLGLSCYNLKSGNLLWEFGKNKFTVNSYSVVEDKVFVVAQNKDFETYLHVVDVLNGTLLETIESDVEPEYITFIDRFLYVSGLLGIEIYK